MRFIPAVLLATLMLASPLAASEATTVILVRHAEKAGSDGDTPLSAEGQARANELARVLAGVKADAIYVTQYRRTRDTAQPYADAIGVTPSVVNAGGGEFATALADRIRKEHAGQTVVVVGHSNTTVDVARALGAANVPSIPEPRFDDLFVCTLAGGKTTFVPLRYGAASPR